MVATLAHRQSIPIMIAIPNDPDAIKLLRLLLALFNFMWRNRQEIFLLVENVNKVFDLIEAFLEFCGVCYDAYEWFVCTVKSELEPTILNYI